jgi:hypothetical protein
MKKDKHPLVSARESIINSIPDHSPEWKKAITAEVIKLFDGAIHWEMVKNLPDPYYIGHEGNGEFEGKWRQHDHDAGDLYNLEVSGTAEKVVEYYVGCSNPDLLKSLKR